MGRSPVGPAVMPTTKLGRWSSLAIVVFGLLMAVFALLVASGQRGGEEFFDNLWLTIPVLAAYGAAVVALGTGIAAMIRAGERSFAVIISTIIGLAVTAFGVAEVAFPH